MSIVRQIARTLYAQNPAVDGAGNVLPYESEEAAGKADLALRQAQALVAGPDAKLRTEWGIRRPNVPGPFFVERDSQTNEREVREDVESDPGTLGMRRSLLVIESEWAVFTGPVGPRSTS